MRAFGRDLIRGGHYGQRSCEPHLKAEHMAAPTNAAYVKKALANSEPSTHGTSRQISSREFTVGIGWKADIGRQVVSAQTCSDGPRADMRGSEFLQRKLTSLVAKSWFDGLSWSQMRLVPSLGKAMRRREFITLIGGAAASWPLVARSQQTDRVRRIGVLSSLARDDQDNNVRIAAFQQRLQQLDWTDGHN